jgi:hypothetical protein
LTNNVYLIKSHFSLTLFFFCRPEEEHAFGEVPEEEFRVEYNKEARAEDVEEEDHSMTVDEDDKETKKKNQKRKKPRGKKV